MSAADDIPLSTAHGRTSGWIAVHQYRGAPYEDDVRGLEVIMDDAVRACVAGNPPPDRGAALA